MSLEKIREEYRSLQERINDLNNQMKEKSKVLMRAEFADFFAKYDGVVANLFWTQYTPRFNDGEACEFEVHDVWLTLRSDLDDEDFNEDGEGSTVYDERDIKSLNERIAKWEDYNKDPMAAARAYQSDYIKRYNRDPFAPDGYDIYGRSKTTEQKMGEWKPDYTSLERLRFELAAAEKIVSNYPELNADYRHISSMVAGIDESLMAAMFGDGVKVIVTKDSIEVEEYDHD